jgi:hypothetical protein
MDTEQLLQKAFKEFVVTQEGVLLRNKTGKEAGYLDKTTGYRRVSIGNKKVHTHQLVYFMSYGVWPSLVDHIDRNKLNNSPTNLRVVSHKENICNSDKVHQARGVAFHKASGKWTAYLPRNGNKHQRHIGLFETEQEALRAVQERKKYG